MSCPLRPTKEELYLFLSSVIKGGKSLTIFFLIFTCLANFIGYQYMRFIICLQSSSNVPNHVHTTNHPKPSPVIRTNLASCPGHLLLLPISILNAWGDSVIHNWSQPMLFSHQIFLVQLKLLIPPSRVSPILLKLEYVRWIQYVRNSRSSQRIQFKLPFSLFGELWKHCHILC